MNSPPAQTGDASAGEVDDDVVGDSNVVGGGAINEKPRYYRPTDNTTDSGSGFGKSSFDGWNPSSNLAHMLHALVGLERYPNYLGRFQYLSDIELLENALESRLSDVRRQRSEIIQRRKGIQQLVKRYTLSMTEFVGFNDDSPCALWRDHPILSPPQTWIELRDKKMLSDHAFRVAHLSTASMKKARNAKGDKSTKAGTSMSMRHESVALHPVRDIIDGKVQIHLRQSLLEEFVCQEMFDVYSFPLLTAEVRHPISNPCLGIWLLLQLNPFFQFCSLLRTTLRDLSTLAESDEFAHLQLGRRPIDLDTIGLGWITDLLFHMFIHPISRHLFATTEKLANHGGAVDNTAIESRILDWRQGYVAGYSAKPMERNGAQRNFLVPHTDDSEVTLNCCLGEESFVGGDVEFHGLRGTPEEGMLVGTARRPNVGTALLHSGRHLHSVSNVMSGDRYALIIWSRSWGNLRSSTCPCCWMNRRQDTTCICGKRWN